MVIKAWSEKCFFSMKVNKKINESNKQNKIKSLLPINDTNLFANCFCPKAMTSPSQVDQEKRTISTCGHRQTCWWSWMQIESAVLWTTRHRQQFRLSGLGQGCSLQRTFPLHPTGPTDTNYRAIIIESKQWLKVISLSKGLRLWMGDGRGMFVVQSSSTAWSRVGRSCFRWWCRLAHQASNGFCPKTTGAPRSTFSTKASNYQILHLISFYCQMEMVVSLGHMLPLCVHEIMRWHHDDLVTWLPVEMYPLLISGPASLSVLLSHGCALAQVFPLIVITRSAILLQELGKNHGRHKSSRLSMSLQSSSMAKSICSIRLLLH